jgi:hypothetical protein
MIRLLIDYSGLMIYSIRLYKYNNRFYISGKENNIYSNRYPNNIII